MIYTELPRLPPAKSRQASVISHDFVRLHCAEVELQGCETPPVVANVFVQSVCCHPVEIERGLDLGSVTGRPVTG